MPLYREVWEAMRKRGMEPEVACEPFHVGAQQVGILRTRLPDSPGPVAPTSCTPILRAFALRRPPLPHGNSNCRPEAATRETREASPVVARCVASTTRLSRT
jgi:hypothetical protein